MHHHAEDPEVDVHPMQKNQTPCMSGCLAEPDLSAALEQVRLGEGFAAHAIPYVTTLIRCYQERAPKRTESKIIIILRMRNAMYMYKLHNSPLL